MDEVTIKRCDFSVSFFLDTTLDDPIKAGEKEGNIYGWNYNGVAHKRYLANTSQTIQSEYSERYKRLLIQCDTVRILNSDIYEIKGDKVELISQTYKDFNSSPPIIFLGIKHVYNGPIQTDRIMYFFVSIVGSRTETHNQNTGTQVVTGSESFFNLLPIKDMSMTSNAKANYIYIPNNFATKDPVINKFFAYVDLNTMGEKINLPELREYFLDYVSKEGGDIQRKRLVTNLFNKL